MKKPKSIKKIELICCTITAGVMLCAPSAHAGLAPLTGFTSLTGTGVALSTIGGTLYNSIAPQPFTIYFPPVTGAAIDTGTLATYVYKNTTLDPNGLLFEYVLTVTKGYIGSLSINGTDFSPLSVGYGTGTGIAGAASTPLTGSSAGYDDDSGINFSLAANSSGKDLGTYYLLAASPYNQDALSSAFVIDDGIAGPITTLVPVPEPTTLLAGGLLLLPCGASTLRMLRKKQTA